MTYAAGGGFMKFRACVLTVIMAIFFPGPAAAAADRPFKFESISSLDKMNGFIKKKFPLRSDRSKLRRVFVEEGRATLKTHPALKGVEKYIYDINLCGYYVWRWNISADYDAKGRLLQAYVNGPLVFADGTPMRKISASTAPGKRANLYKATRPRPEAVKGENVLSFMLYDGDGDAGTVDDQKVIGGGPASADPGSAVQMVVYADVEAWRSIFDSDNAGFIAPFPGDCAAVDRKLEKVKAQSAP
jgi:hypothetical protein